METTKQELKIVTIENNTIEAFKKEWPCHNFPKDLDIINVVFDDKGDLIDYELLDEDDDVIATGERIEDLHDFKTISQEGLSALFLDAYENAKPTLFDTRFITDGLRY